MDCKGGTMLPNGFRVLPVKFDVDSNAIRQLFYKPHRIRLGTNDDEKPEGRTLFIINVPPYCTEESIAGLFETYGKIKKVILQHQPTEGNATQYMTVVVPEVTSKINKAFKVAYVVFTKEVHLKNVLQATFPEPLFLSTPERPLHLGTKKWAREYNTSIPDAAAMEAKINQFMMEYDKKQQEEQKLAKEAEGVPDDDGWIKVTKYSKKSVISRTEAKQKRINEKESSKKPRKELQNFYTFQIRESKMEHIVQLRKKFEDDKRRISLMKETRKFKPY